MVSEMVIAAERRASDGRLLAARKGYLLAASELMEAIAPSVSAAYFRMANDGETPGLSLVESQDRCQHCCARLDWSKSPAFESGAFNPRKRLRKILRRQGKNGTASASLSAWEQSFLEKCNRRRREKTAIRIPCSACGKESSVPIMKNDFSSAANTNTKVVNRRKREGSTNNNNNYPFAQSSKSFSKNGGSLSVEKKEDRKKKLSKRLKRGTGKLQQMIEKQQQSAAAAANTSSPKPKTLAQNSSKRTKTSSLLANFISSCS